MSRESLGACRLIATAIAMLLLIQTTGCVSWQPQTGTIVSMRKAKPTDSYRFTLAGGWVYRLTNVRIQGDSVFGTTKPETMRPGSGRATAVPIGFPWSQVRGVERREDETGKGFLIMGAMIGFIALAGASMFSLGPIGMGY